MHIVGEKSTPHVKETLKFSGGNVMMCLTSEGVDMCERIWERIGKAILQFLNWGLRK